MPFEKVSHMDNPPLWIIPPPPPPIPPGLSIRTVCMLRFHEFRHPSPPLYVNICF